MTLVLWGRATSSNVFKVMWLLDELGLAHERRDVGGPFGYPEGYEALHPLRRVPALQWGDARLWESHAILRYVARRAGTTPLYPEPDQGGALVDAWLDWQLAAMATPMRRVFQAVVRGGAPYSGADAADLADAMTTFAAHVSGPYLLGADLTLADMAVAPNAHRWIELAARSDDKRLEAAPPPALIAWRDGLRRHRVFDQFAAEPVV